MTGGKVQIGEEVQIGGAVKISGAKQIWLGAYSPGGLALPAAQPTAAQLYAPRGVYFDDDFLIAADSGNHRILIWRGVPETDCRAADLVLGQADFLSEGPKLLHLPTGVMMHEGKLIVADAWHHRLLVWEQMPETNNAAPDYAIGQPKLDSVEPNRGQEKPSADSLYWPYGFGFAAGWFWIADTGNRRVLGWPSLPKANEPAQIVLGQPDATSSEENRGAAAGARSFRWPHAIAGDAHRLLVSDAGNHRVLGWSPMPCEDSDAALALGQKDFTTAAELPYIKQGPSKLRFPYSIALEGARLAVADTANNRILIWDETPLSGCGAAADHVLGQPGFDSNGENRWKAVTHDSLCWPYGIWMHKGRLAVADSGNNRVTLWNLTELDQTLNESAALEAAAATTAA